MAELVNSRAVINRTDASGTPMPADRKTRSDDFNSDSRIGWNWRKGLTKPLPRYPPIIARASGDPAELSFGQQRLWFLAELESGSAAYNVPMAWRITGALNLSALQRTLD